MSEDFKERITRNASNKHIFDPIKREKWKSLEDRVTLTKIKIYVNMNKKYILGLLAAKSDQSKSAVNIKNTMPFPLVSVSLNLNSADGTMQKKKNSNLYGAIDLLSNRNFSLKNYTGVNYVLYLQMRLRP